MGSQDNNVALSSNSFLAYKSAKVFVAGHRGLVGSAIVRKLTQLGFTNLVLHSHAELDLTRQSDVEAFFASEKPEFVIVAAAKVGGIHANNTYPADFIAINLQIQTNVIDSAYRNGAKKLLFLGSSCIYPKYAPQPIPEDALLTGPLEPTNEWYAIAKIAGIKMCQAYRIQHKWDAISGMPTNLYGPYDNFHPENSHVLPALMRRFHEAKVNGAKEVVVWGTGSPLREFLHVDDLADAVVFMMEKGQARCGLGMEDWESVLSESPGQDHSILKLIMGDIEDPSVGLTKLLQGGSGSQDVEFNGVGVGFGLVDQSSVLFPIPSVNFVSSSSSIDPSGTGNCSDFPFNSQTNVSPNVPRVGSGVNPNTTGFPASASNLSPVSLPQGVFLPQQQQQHHPPIEPLDEKLQVLNPQFILNQNQSQFMPNAGLVLPLTYGQLQENHQLLPQPPAKRLNCGPNYQVPKTPFLDSGQELLLRRQQQQLQLLPHHLLQRPSMVVAPKQKMVNSGGQDLATHQLQQAITEQLFKAAELIDAGNLELAHGILARLNHQLSPIGKPFQRAAFYFKEALQLLLHSNANNSSFTFSPTGLLLKIGAYKSFSEISPVLQFANFTCNQALLEAVKGFDRIHIIDFDIGLGGQWSSFMQELALRNGGAPELKITAFVSPSHHDEIELSFTQESLKQYAGELRMPFELEILSLESLNSASWPQPLRDCKAVVVNMPIGSFSNYPSYLPLVLRFVKQLMPKIVVTLDRSCDRTDAPFPQHLIFALQSYSGLLESLDAVNVHPDVLQMIEKYYLQPSMEKLVLGRHGLQERALPWKNLLLSSGFSPLTFSNFTESQAECLVQRTPSKGFHVEKRQSSLVLCWQRKDLISVSTWRC